MKKRNIILISFGHFEKDVIQSIISDIKNELNCELTFYDYNIELNDYYDPQRRQYDANRLLNFVDKLHEKSDDLKIGLFRVDIFIPILTYIFGQAQLNGNAAIVSLYRLKNELYGIEPNNELLHQRFRKIIIHELGHMLGLLHCLNPICVMRSSTYVEDVDQKEIHFCSKCKLEIQ